jgi:hypothetical protein
MRGESYGFFVFRYRQGCAVEDRRSHLSTISIYLDHIAPTEVIEAMRSADWSL